MPVDHPLPTRRDRISARLAELARMLRAAITIEDRDRIADELNRLAVGG